MEHDAYKEMLAEGALGALGPDDERALAEHLRACDACRAESDGLRDVAAMLAHTVAPVAPPPHLRARILEQIKTPARDELTNRVEDDPARADKRSGETGEAGAARVLPFSADRKSSGSFVSRRFFNAVAVAASLLLVALVSLALMWQRDRAELARLSARERQLSADAERARQELAQARESSELLTSPETLFATLEGTKAAPDAGARVAFDARTGRALLLAYDLPPAPAGKAYQLWFIKGTERPVPGRVFKTDERGRGSLRDQAPPEGLQADTFAVTLEPEQGVPAATGEIYLVGKIS